MARNPSRDEELSTRKRIREALLKVFEDVDQGFQAQGGRADDQLDYWDLYNCELGPRQYYNGTSKIFVPIIHNAVNARKTRFVNQVFPQAGRFVEVTTQDGHIPHAEVALAEHYVERAKLRTQVLPALVRNGDIEGQYNLYVSWSTRKRHVVWRTEKPVKVMGADLEGVNVEDIEEDTIIEDRPAVEVLHDSDVLIYPSTCDSVDDALENGGHVTILRRWTKEQISALIEDGDFERSAGESLKKNMQRAADGKIAQRDQAKFHADAAGVKDKGKTALGYETWVRLKVGGQRRTCRAYYGGDNLILGCKLNPYWCDRVPLITHPVEKVAGQIKGISKVKPCTESQLAANDAVNEGMDSAAYALLPIVMTDPVKNPRVGTMILDQAAIWETSPNDTKFASFPALWKEAFEIVNAATQIIEKTLSVTPAAIPQSSGTKTKRNQAEIANEQQVDILTTADAVTVLEHGVLTPLIQRFMEYDAQFREDSLSVKMFGRLGIQAQMERVPPLQMGRRYRFRWFGVEQARTAAQIQQKIAMLNVVRGVPPNMIPGKRIDLTALIEDLVESVCGPRLAPLTFVDVSDDLAIDPEVENSMLKEGHVVPVSPFDDDKKHLAIHQQAMGDDPQGTFHAHLAKHMMAMQMKAAAEAQAQQPQGQPPQGGGGGQPRPGGQVAGPRQNKGPPGMIKPDQMPRAGSVGMPRKT